MDAVDWEVVRQANVDEVAEIIKDQGMNNVIAGKIKDFLNKIVEEQGCPDLEWLRDVPPEEAKTYLLNIFGIGLKSVECIRLLTLHHVAFPVDTNVRRVAVRLGWVPLKPLPEGLQMHLLEMYPVVNSIQKYLYPRLCTLDQEKLYLLHYHLITFGKIFCTKRKPNCNACPMRGECKYFASAFASHRLDLPSPERKDIVTTQNFVAKTPLVLQIDPDVSDREYQHIFSKLGSKHLRQKCEPIIEYPASPGPSEPEDIEDLFKVSNELNDFGNYDDDDIPIIRIDSEACMNNIIEYAKGSNISFEGENSKILALLNSSNALPMPPLKHAGRLRTVHQVYELPDDHPILDDVDKRDPDDPSPYLFAVWNEGKHRSSVSHTSSTRKQVRYNIVCNCSEPDCESLVCGTLLIPVRSANHGTFPLNGTYFQVNEVFADDESSERPIVVPRDWLWGLTRRNLYRGTSPATIFKGFTLYHIQHAFCKGFFCNRGFNREKRCTTTLGHRFHINTMQPKEKATCHKQ
ncbi:DNA glycosylase/AP lyase ROS1-like [Daucus carota subsp. sativus]